MQDSQQQQGRRMRALSDAFHRTTKFALRPEDKESFRTFFPGLVEEYVEVAYDAYQQALHKARVLAEADFQLICEENVLRDKLYALETLCEEQGIADGEAPAAGSLQHCPKPARAAPFCEAQQREADELQEMLAQATEGLAGLQSQLAGRQQQVQAVLQKARPIAQANQQVHEASKAWCSRCVEAVS